MRIASAWTLIPLLLAALGAAPAGDARPRQAPSSATLSLAVDAWWRQQIIGEFAAHGRVEPRFAKQIPDLLEFALAGMTGASSTVSADAMTKVAHGMIYKGGEAMDPVVLWAAAQAYKPGMQQAITLIGRALARWDARPATAPPYARYLRAAAARHHFVELVHDGSRKGGIPPAHREGTLVPEAAAFIRAFAGALAEPMPDGVRDELLHRVLDRMLWLDPITSQLMHRHLLPIISGATVPAALRESLLATIHHQTGWAIRGGDWGSLVPVEQMQGFAEHLRTASAHAERSWALRPNLPAARLGIAIAGAGYGTTSAADWFARSLSLCIDDEPSFKQRLIYLMPRWGGSYEEAVRVGIDGVASGRYDSDRPWQIVLAAQAVLRDIDSLEQIDRRQRRPVQRRRPVAAFADPAFTAALERCFAGYAPVMDLPLSQWDPLRAILHHHAGRTERARQLIAAIGETRLKDDYAEGWFTSWAEILGRPRQTEPAAPAP